MPSVATKKTYGLRDPRNRSLLSVNEDFEGERNAENIFLCSFFTYSSWPTNPSRSQYG